MEKLVFLLSLLSMLYYNFCRNAIFKTKCYANFNICKITVITVHIYCVFSEVYVPSVEWNLTSNGSSCQGGRGGGAVGWSVRPQAESLVFQSPPQQTQVVKTSSDSSTVKRSALGVIATGPWR